MDFNSCIKLLVTAVQLLNLTAENVGQAKMSKATVKKLA